MSGSLLVVHERIGVWSRQLKARLGDRPVRLVESRSGADLEAALAGAAVPVVLIDLGRRVRSGLDDLQRGLAVSPDALALVLDPLAHEGVAWLAREAGATHVITGPVTPPAVATLLARWLILAARRAGSCGWTGPALAEPEPWNWLNPILDPRPT